MLFDELWELIAALTPVLSKINGGNVPTGEVFAWKIGPEGALVSLCAAPPPLLNVLCRSFTRSSSFPHVLVI